VASVNFTARMAAGIVFDPALSGVVSATLPWGTPWLGRTSDWDGFYNNIRIPFYQSIRVTARLPPGSQPFNVYTIIRGTENVPIEVNGFRLPAGARMRTHTNQGLEVPSLGFVAIVNKTSGDGLILQHTLGFRGSPSFLYLEGCFHLITPFGGSGMKEGGVGAGYPGITLSTGMEDYYDSSYYFHSGLFQLPVSGVTHMCTDSSTRSPPHPACASNKLNRHLSEWSGYRFHDKDPLFFHHGVQLLVRNGDVEEKVSYGTAKCFNLQATGGPGPSTVDSLAWVYEWDSSSPHRQHADGSSQHALRLSVDDGASQTLFGSVLMIGALVVVGLNCCNRPGKACRICLRHKSRSLDSCHSL